MEHFVSRDRLDEGLETIKKSPTDSGIVEMLAVRPVSQERTILTQCQMSAELGVHGDRWVKDSWKTLADGKSDPEVQVAISNSRSIDLVAGTRDRWSLLGDNLYIDFDLSEDNIQIGDRLSIGSVILEISSEPNYGCAKYLKHYGKDALKFLNIPEGRRLRLRGVFAKIVKDGSVSVGDLVRKHQ
ncbi:MAG: MOSC domain-containing protein [Planctomycetes bacterium]|nr:MOSC domain-containing protein [Planctomycetota bacterium]